MYMKINLSGQNFKNMVVSFLPINYINSLMEKVITENLNANQIEMLQHDYDCHGYKLFTGSELLEIEIGSITNDTLKINCDSLNMYDMDCMSKDMEKISDEIKFQIVEKELKNLGYICSYDFEDIASEILDRQDLKINSFLDTGNISVILSNKEEICEIQCEGGEPIEKNGDTVPTLKVTKVDFVIYDDIEE